MGDATEVTEAPRVTITTEDIRRIMRQRLYHRIEYEDGKGSYTEGLDSNIIADCADAIMEAINGSGD